jgi:hypothetical protein
MAHNARIAAAIADLESQDRPNISSTAKRHGVARKTLADLFNGKSSTLQEANSYARQQLSDIQEETLIEYVKKLTDQGFPPTPQIFKNIAESVAHQQLLPTSNASCVGGGVMGEEDQLVHLEWWEFRLSLYDRLRVFGVRQHLLPRRRPTRCPSSRPHGMVCFPSPLW